MHRATLIRYQSYLIRLQQLKLTGRTVVTSEDLAEFVGVSASRVRQDLSVLRTGGKPRTGYAIGDLEILIHALLDLLTEKRAALVGIGNLGRALANSEIWSHAGFALRALFDTDRDLIGTPVAGLTVQHVNELIGTVRSERIACGCITVPAPHAQKVADLFVSAGVRAIWNFAPVDLQVPSNVIVENQRLEQGLMTLSFLLAKGPTDHKPQAG
jgi:redox-sensing transcriptional repressor